MQYQGERFCFCARNECLSEPKLKPDECSLTHFSFLPSQILHLSSFCLCIHSYIPFPSHLAIDSHSPSLCVIASFSFSPPLGFLPTHSISPLPDPSARIFLRGGKKQQRDKEEEKIEGERGREAAMSRWRRKGAQRCTFSPCRTTDF